MSLKQRIDELVNKYGSLRAVQDVIGIDAAYLCRLKNGEKINPSKEYLIKLGIKKVITYEVIL
jgi:hypothetical protein